MFWWWSSDAALANSSFHHSDLGGRSTRGSTGRKGGAEDEGINAKIWRSLAEAMYENAELEIVEISNIPILSTTASQDLAKVSISVLLLVCTEGRIQGLIPSLLPLPQGVTHSPKLHTLSLEGCGLGDSGCKSLWPFPPCTLFVQIRSLSDTRTWCTNWEFPHSFPQTPLECHDSGAHVLPGVLES